MARFRLPSDVRAGVIELMKAVEKLTKANLLVAVA